jgi:hypothetical protein
MAKQIRLEQSMEAVEECDHPAIPDQNMQRKRPICCQRLSVVTLVVFRVLTNLRRADLKTPTLGGPYGQRKRGTAGPQRAHSTGRSRSQAAREISDAVGCCGMLSASGRQEVGGLAAGRFSTPSIMWPVFASRKIHLRQFTSGKVELAGQTDQLYP